MNYFHLLDEYLGDDIVRDDNNGLGLYGAKPLMNTATYSVDTGKTISMLNFTKNTSTLLYEINVFNQKRKKIAGKEFDLAAWNEQYKNIKRAFMWIKPHGTIAIENLLSFVEKNNLLFTLSSNASGKVRLLVSSLTVLTSSKSLNMNQWNLIGIEINNNDSTVKMFVNDEVLSFKDTVPFPSITYLAIGNFHRPGSLDSSVTTIEEKNLLMPFSIAFLAVGSGTKFTTNINRIYQLGLEAFKEKRIAACGAVRYDEALNFDCDLIKLNGSTISEKELKPLTAYRKKDNSDLFTYDEEVCRFVYNNVNQEHNLTNEKPLLYNLNLSNKGSISIKIKPEILQTTSDRNIIGFYKNNKVVFALILSSKTIRFTTSTLSRVSTSRTIKLDTWNTISFTWDENGLKLWINEGSAYTNTVSIDLTNTQMLLGYDIVTTPSGRINKYNNHFLGKMEHLLFSKKVLTASHLKAPKQTAIKVIYDDLGRANRKEINSINNYIIDYEYYPSANNLRTTFDVKRETHVNDKSRIDYSYDSLGNVNSVTETKEGIVIRRVTYQYDNLNRLLNEDDKLSDIKITYAYDDSGNILHKYYYENNSKSNKKLFKKRFYKYEGDIKDTITKSVECVMDGTIEISRKETSYVYQSQYIGCPSIIGENNLTWDQKRLVKYGANEYSYNYEGVRISKKTADNVTTKYNVNGTKVLGISIEDGSNIEKMLFRYDHNNMIVGFKYNNKEFFYIRDILGNINKIIDEEGKTYVTYSYDAYGVPVKKQIGANLNEAELAVSQKLIDINPFIYKGYIYDVDLS